MIAWRVRNADAGIEGRADNDRSDSPRQIDHRAVDRGRYTPATAEEIRGDPLVHPAAREPAGDRLQHCAQSWREYGVAPWRKGTFKFSTDPELVAMVVDVVGLYLAPPENAIVPCVDEKSQVQALERKTPGMPMQPGRRATHSHDHVRHGTSTLLAAREIATGHVTAARKPRHRREEFLAFLKQVARAYPRWTCT